jgi:hypothetical protein
VATEAITDAMDVSFDEAARRIDALKAEIALADSF